VQNNSNNDDPRAPIIIHNHCNRNSKSNEDRILLFRIYDGKNDYDEYQKNIKSLHAAWDVIYDVYNQKKKLEQQLEESNRMMAEYKKKFGDIDDEIDDKKNMKKSKKHYGVWFVLSTILVSSAIFGSAYYLKR